MLMGSTLTFPGELVEHQKRLDDNLASWNLVREPIDGDGDGDGDGDCLFVSVAFSISWSNHTHVLDILQFMDNPTIKNIVPKLRQALVDEWTGPHSTEYQSFLVETQLLAEAPHFLQRRVFVVS